MGQLLAAIVTVLVKVDGPGTRRPNILPTGNRDNAE